MPTTISKEALYSGFLKDISSMEQERLYKKTMELLEEEEKKKNKIFLLKKRRNVFSTAQCDYIDSLARTKDAKGFLESRSPHLIQHMMNNNVKLSNLNLTDKDINFFNLMKIDNKNGVRLFYQSLPGLVKGSDGLMTPRSLGNYFARDMMEFDGLYAGTRKAFFTPNSFKSHSGSKKNTYGIKSIQADLDFRNSINDDISDGYLAPEERIARTKLALTELKIPFPTAIVDSGFGLHLYWIFNEMLIDNTKDQRWINVSESLTTEILSKLNEYDKNAMSPAGSTLDRIYPDTKASSSAQKMRLPGTKTKDSDICHVIELNKGNIIESFHDLAMEIWPGYEHPEYYTGEYIPKKKKTNLSFIFNFKKDDFWAGYNKNRLLDLHKILELRNYNMISYRNSFLHIVGCQLQAAGESVEDIHDWNSKLTPALSKSEVNNIVRSIKRNKHQSYKSIKICNDLDISKEEQLHLLVIQDLNARERRRTKRTKQRELSKRKKSFEMIVSGKFIEVMTNKEIMTILNKSKSTIIRYRRNYKKLTTKEKEESYCILSKEQKDYIYSIISH